MYGTILDDNVMESIDLYVYRSAEHKAKQIGKISRILKETAVDCIINHDQTAFTQEEFSKILNEPITQILSNGDVIRDFKIGDAPYSSGCDYMKECYYTCNPMPTTPITADNTNDNTYCQYYANNSYEAISKKIKVLFSENFFYKKDTLMYLLRTPRAYPYIQIYSALTQMVDDSNETVVDKYGRIGRIVNIDEYYVFQPTEITHPNASVFERSVPVDYKHSGIIIDLNDEVHVEKQIPHPDAADTPMLNDTDDSGDSIELNRARGNKHNDKLTNLTGNIDITQKLIASVAMDNIARNIECVNEYSKKGSVERKDDNWYKHCGVIMKKLMTRYDNINLLEQLSKQPNMDIRHYLSDIIIYHNLDSLEFGEKYELLNYIYSLETIEPRTTEHTIKTYFEMSSHVINQMTVILMYDLNKKHIFKLVEDETYMWVDATFEDLDELRESESPYAKYLFFDSFANEAPPDYNNIVGFVGYEKNNKYLIFKTIDITSKRNTGARCDESGKLKTIDIINNILGGEIRYTKANTQKHKDSNGKSVSAVVQSELCVLQEILLRYFQMISHIPSQNGKIYFISPETSILWKFK